MRIISIEDPESIPIALDVLRNGGVIVYPTETAYGLGVDATNVKALEKIFKIKGRDEGKALTIIVGNMAQAHRYAIFSDIAEKLAIHFWPGPLTLILPPFDHTTAYALRSETDIGVRIPGYTWCRNLSKKLNCPVTSTSANASGSVPEYSIEGVQKSLGSNRDLVDLWIDGGVLPDGPVSTIVRLVEDFKIQREGAVSREDIEKVLE